MGPEPGPHRVPRRFPKGSFNLALLKSLGLLDKHLPGVALKWVEFPAGLQLLEAWPWQRGLWRRGRFAARVCAGCWQGPLLRRRRAPRSPTAGRAGAWTALSRPWPSCVAVAWPCSGSSAHYLLVRAVRRGLQWADIQPIYLAPADARRLRARLGRCLGRVGPLLRRCRD